MSVNIQTIIELAKQAGEGVMRIYQKDFDIHEKSDASPLTEADLISHHCILAGLAELTPDIPVLSEESSSVDTQERMNWGRYWLIDPLDGTKEFIKKNGEFTINIALIEHHRPVLGVVHVPARETTYYGEVGQGAFKQTAEGTHPITPAAAPGDRDTWRIVGSRSHQSDAFTAFTAAIPNTEIIAMGSSIKLCLVAEGAADLYPRLGPTSEWDTAAAQAVVEAAGGQVLEYPSLLPMRYNKRADTLLNPWFIVCSELAPIWAEPIKAQTNT